MTVSSYNESINGATSLHGYPSLSENSTFTGYVTGSKTTSHFVIPVNYSDAVSFTFSGTNIEDLQLEYRFVVPAYLTTVGAYGGLNFDSEHFSTPTSVAAHTVATLSASNAGGF